MSVWGSTWRRTIVTALSLHWVRGDSQFGQCSVAPLLTRLRALGSNKLQIETRPDHCQRCTSVHVKLLFCARMRDGKRERGRESESEKEEEKRERQRDREESMSRKRKRGKAEYWLVLRERRERERGRSSSLQVNAEPCGVSLPPSLSLSICKNDAQETGTHTNDHKQTGWEKGESNAKISSVKDGVWKE